MGVPAGRIGRPHGLRGEVTIVPADASYFRPGSSLERADGPPLLVREARSYRDRGLVVLFEGCRTRRDAEALRGIELEIAHRPPLEDGEWWVDNLVGIAAVDPDGSPLGRVVEVITGAQDRLAVETPDGDRVEVPFVDAIVSDPVDGRVVIDAPDGLF